MTEAKKPAHEVTTESEELSEGELDAVNGGTVGKGGVIKGSIIIQSGSALRALDPGITGDAGSAGNA